MERTNGVQAIAKSDYSYVPAGRKAVIRAMLKLTVEQSIGKRTTPLNIALVLDRSGSMSGEKLEYVKRAAAMLASRLRADDIISVTAFDERVNTVALPAPAENAPSLEAAIDSIEVGGCTDLAAGYDQGAKYAVQYAGNGRTSRVFLLTDGLANVGVTDPAVMTARASQYAGHSVTTTAIGVGEGYNEELLAAIAERGGGNFYFIEKPSDAPDVFKEELGYLFTLAATNVRARFEPTHPAIRATQLNNYLRIDGSGYLLGELYGGQARYLLLEAELSAPTETGPFTAGSFIIEYSELRDGTLEDRTLTVPLLLNAVNESELPNYASQQPDKEVTLQAAYLYLAREKSSAISAADAHKFDDAAAILTECARFLQSLRLNDPRLDEEIRLLLDRAELFRTMGKEFYTPMERKQMFHEKRIMYCVNMASYDAMMERNPRKKKSK